MKYKVNIHEKNGIRTIMAEEGENLLELLGKAGIRIEAACGGRGTCGKCAVRLAMHGDTPEECDESEIKLLGADRMKKGCRLACRARIKSHMDVFPDAEEREASIAVAGKMRDVAVDPIIKKKYVEYEPPTLENWAPCLEGLARQAGLELMAGIEPRRLSMLRDIPRVLAESCNKATLISIGGKLAAIEPGDTTGNFYGAAIDIGTTTVAAYLYNLKNGGRSAAASALNPQRKYGADVIARINHAMQSEQKAHEMRELIINCVNGLLKELATGAGISRGDIYAAVFAGNTTMLHLLLGLDVSKIAVSPFVPVTTGPACFSPDETGLDINKSGIIAVFPSVSAYVGGDTVAAILSTGIYEADEISLLVDIGTNGEIVLGNREWLLACSTAAGPAFEGANIRCGMGSVAGAINSVGPGPEFKFTTIGGAKAAGICGSGIIDAVARLLDAGIIDETGRMAGEGEMERLAPEIRGRLVVRDGDKAFMLAQGNNGRDREQDKGRIEEWGKNRDSGRDNGNGRGSNRESARIGESGCIGEGGHPDARDLEMLGNDVYITQKDIREIQNAKAAIAAGVETLMKEAGISAGGIKKVYLAGGFGSGINVESAIRIGLLPGCSANMAETVGNASGAGASEGLLSAGMLKLSGYIAKKVKYVELSASSCFNERYVENMLF